jgi:predicted LPLAT superfamily acyltransferase
MGGIRLMASVHRVLGRRVCRALLYPVVAYFFARDTSVRRASRRYLERVWARPEGRRRLGRRPGARTPFRHLLEFAVQLQDRMVLWGSGLTQLRMDHHGGEHLFALARARRGGILLGAHLGSFDMPRQLAGDHGLTLNVVMFTAHAERINRFFEQLDPDSRVRVLHLDPGSVRAAFEIKACIDRGELVGILADRVPAGGRERPVRVDFLGEPAAFPLSPFLLACLLGCPVFLSLCVRTGSGRYETRVEPLTEGRRVPRDAREEAARELARAYVRGLERACLRHPFQWFNFYDVWSTRPTA